MSPNTLLWIFLHNKNIFSSLLLHGGRWYLSSLSEETPEDTRRYLGRHRRRSDRGGRTRLEHTFVNQEGCWSQTVIRWDHARRTRRPTHAGTWWGRPPALRTRPCSCSWTRRAGSGRAAHNLRLWSLHTRPRLSTEKKGFHIPRLQERSGEKPGGSSGSLWFQNLTDSRIQTIMFQTGV